MSHPARSVLVTTVTLVSDMVDPLLVLIPISVVHLIWRVRIKHSQKREQGTERTDRGGQWTGVVLRMLRAAGSILLLVLSTLQVLTGGPKADVEMMIFFVYTSLLSLAGVFSTSHSRLRLTDAHLSILFVALFGVLLYSDLYPMLRIDGPIPNVSMLARLALVFFLGVFVPLTLPGLPSRDARARASLLSRITWGYYDSIIWYAARHADEHLAADRLPPLEADDALEHLVEKHFGRIDPTMPQGRRYVVWSLLHIFKWEYIAMVTLIVLETFASYIAPISIRQILDYLESKPSTSPVRPWVWVLCMGAGPIIVAFTREWYQVHATRVLAQAEAVLTQLVFTHALRIRLGADPSAAASSAEGDKDAGKKMVGKITNLVTSDMRGLAQARDWPLIVQAVLSFALGVVLLYGLLGWSALIGAVVILIVTPVHAFSGKRLLNSQRQMMKAADKHVQAVSQTMSVLRMIKLFGWERKSVEKMSAIRDEELAWVSYNRLVASVNHNMNILLPLLNIVVTFGIYTLVMKEELTASRVFTSVSVSSILIHQLEVLSIQVLVTLNGIVALDRIDAFLHQTVLIHPPGTFPTMPSAADAVGFQNASFTWHDPSTPLQSGVRTFKLDIPGTLTFAHGAVNLIVGPTGAGKTSLLFALLGEMYFTPESPSGWYNLPRDGGIAYAAQESWVLNDTIQENIVFGSSFDEERYRKVIEQCALEEDLSMFAAGDMTEVGEKGLTLSGGQKARVTLARAVYSSAQIVLLDDVLAAIDVHTARWIVERCLKGDLLRGRTVLLVTHNLALTRSIAQKLIHVDGRGYVTESSSLQHLVDSDSALAQELEKDERLLARDSPAQTATVETETKRASEGKLTVAEEVARGSVGLATVRLYVDNVGGLSFGTVVVFVFGQAAMYTLQPFWLGLWSHQYEMHSPSEVSAVWFLSGYTALVLLELVFSATSYALWSFGAVRASRRITRMLVESIMTATFRWLDTVPVARVITRCTQDLKSIDHALPSQMYLEFQVISGLLLKLGALVYVLGWHAVIMGSIMMVMGSAVGYLYVVTQRSVKREQSVAKSPVLSVIGAGMAGLPSIRAYGAQDYFNRQLMARINVFTHLYRHFFGLNRWVSIRIQTLGGIFSAIIAGGVVYGDVLSVGNAGFALSQVVGFSLSVFSFVRISNQLEVECNSLERVKDFIDIEHEPAPSSDGVPPAYWPASGSLRVENLSARYGANSPDVLRDVSFEIKSGERVGVVGRTGAGKSTITLALFRAMLTSGKILYDGIDVHTVNLEALRANITLIPQDPELLADTVRENLDPFGEHDDAVLHDALRCAGLFRLQEEGSPSAITLDLEVEGSGANFSHGQRQIIALARAQVRQSKLMIMDEATAAIDYETDTAIQESIRTNLGSDVTVITIAHRLQTIMDSDKIIVLESGRLAQVGAPAELLAQKAGMFYDLVEKSHDRDALYRMVKS